MRMIAQKLTEGGLAGFRGMLNIILYTSFFVFFTVGITTCWAASITLEWNPSPDSDVVAYAVYSRTANCEYDYQHALWQGDTNRCSFDASEFETDTYFVARAINKAGIKSDNSNEVVYRISDKQSDAGLPSSDGSAAPSGTADTPSADADDAGAAPSGTADTPSADADDTGAAPSGSASQDSSDASDTAAVVPDTAPDPEPVSGSETGSMDNTSDNDIYSDSEVDVKTACSLLVNMPPNGGLVSSLNPILSVADTRFDSTNDTALYEFELYKDAGLSESVMSAVVPAEDGNAECEVLPELDNNTCYYWRARRVQGKRADEWMVTPVMFKVDTAAFDTVFFPDTIFYMNEGPHQVRLETGLGCIFEDIALDLLDVADDCRNGAIFIGIVDGNPPLPPSYRQLGDAVAIQFSNIFEEPSFVFTAIGQDSCSMEADRAGGGSRRLMYFNVDTMTWQPVIKTETTTALAESKVEYQLLKSGMYTVASYDPVAGTNLAAPSEADDEPQDNQIYGLPKGDTASGGGGCFIGAIF